MAYRVLDGRAVVLAVWRGPARRGTLDAETWHSRVVDTTVVDSRTHELAPAAEPAATGREVPGAGRRLAEGALKALPWGRGR